MVSEESRNFALAFRDRGSVTYDGDADAPFGCGGWTGCRPDEKKRMQAGRKPDENEKKFKIAAKILVFQKLVVTLQHFSAKTKSNREL